MVITTECLAPLGVRPLDTPPGAKAIRQGHADPGSASTEGKLPEPRGGDDTIPRLKSCCECLFSMCVRPRGNPGASEHPEAFHDRAGRIGLVRGLSETAGVDLQRRARLDQGRKERFVQLR